MFCFRSFLFHSMSPFLKFIVCNLLLSFHSNISSSKKNISFLFIFCDFGNDESFFLYLVRVEIDMPSTLEHCAIEILFIFNTFFAVSILIAFERHLNSDNSMMNNDYFVIIQLSYLNYCIKIQQN